MKTKTLKKVVLAVSVPQTVGLGEPVEMIVKLTNKNSQPVYYSETTGFMNCEVQLMDRKGKRAKLKQIGRELLRFGGNGESSRLIILPIESGETKKWVLDLAKCFELSRGEYALSFSVTLNEREPAPFKIGIQNAKFQVE